MNLNTVIPLTSASRLQSYLQRFCSRETFQLISFPLCGALPPTPLFHSLFLDSTIMKKAFFVKDVSRDFTNLCLQLFIKWIKSSSLPTANNLITVPQFIRLNIQKQRANIWFTRCKRNPKLWSFCKKGFLSAILFTELFKLICYELNFRTDYNLNRIFTRSDHTGNTG